MSLANQLFGKSGRFRGLYEAVRNANNTRTNEVSVAKRFLGQSRRILDVGCGTGPFLAELGARAVGVDYNFEAVRIARRKGHTAAVADALRLPFQDSSFDAAYTSHVLHVFSSHQVQVLLSELIRVVKPGGPIVIATIPDSPRAWIHAENARPYPPSAIRGMFRTPSTETESSPTMLGLPTDIAQTRIWFRRPPLVDIIGHRSDALAAFGSILGGLQYRVGLRKYWSFNGYIVEFKNTAKRPVQSDIPR